MINLLKDGNFCKFNIQYESVRIEKKKMRTTCLIFFHSLFSSDESFFFIFFLPNGENFPSLKISRMNIFRYNKTITNLIHMRNYSTLRDSSSIRVVPNRIINQH